MPADPAELAWLEVAGRSLVDPAGRSVVLRGVGLGGWMNMENFINGYPSTESRVRHALGEVLDRTLLEGFFERLLDVFFADEDARFLAGLGLNVVRLPVNYHHLEDDDRPGVLKAAGLELLDRAIRRCREVGLYTLIDLHALPGGQNHDWHSDNPAHLPLLWQHRDFQDRSVVLWQALADRYRDEPAVAGYNLINEPADPTGERLGPFYQRLAAAVRDVDDRHVLFLDGDRYAQDFAHLGGPIENAVYALHHYPLPGMVTAGPYPGMTRGEHFDRDRIRQEYQHRAEPLATWGVPVLVGEFGPMYCGDPGADAMRRQLLADQVEIYEEDGASWCLWTYKDLGLQGLRVVDPASAWRSRLGAIIDKKERLGVDSWGGRPEGLADVLEPLERRFTAEFETFSPYPFGARNYLHRLVRHTLFSEPLAEEFAASFRGLGEEALVEMADSFRFSECRERTELCDLLRKLAGGGQR